MKDFWRVTPDEAAEFLSLHSTKIRDFNDGCDPVEFFYRVTERDPMMRDDDGDVQIEIKAHESHSGNPVIFYLYRPQQPTEENGQ